MTVKTIIAKFLASEDGKPDYNGLSGKNKIIAYALYLAYCSFRLTLFYLGLERIGQWFK